MSTNLKKTIANNLAIATVLLSSGMPFAANIMPANALSKSEVNETSIVSPTPQKSITIAQNSNISFPIGGEQEDRVKKGKEGKRSLMKTSFSLNSSGKLTATTRTWTERKYWGFTGGVTIVLTDASKNPIWYSQTQRYGVDGRKIGRNDRTETWQATVPKNILDRVGGYAIVQQHNPTRRFGKKVIEALTVIVNNFQSNQTSGGGSIKILNTNDPNMK